MAQLTLAQAKFLLIATFNEFHEGTQIEPAFPINHDDTAQFSQAGSSYGFTFIDIVATRGKYVMYGMTGGGGGGVARRC